MQTVQRHTRLANVVIPNTLISLTNYKGPHTYGATSTFPLCLTPFRYFAAVT